MLLTALGSIHFTLKKYMWNVNISMKKGIKEICIPKTQLTYCQICVNFNADVLKKKKIFVSLKHITFVISI